MSFNRTMTRRKGVLSVALTAASLARAAIGQCEDFQFGPSDNQDGQRFGWSLAAAGDTVAIGAPNYDGRFPDQGTAHVHRRVQQGWSEQQLIPADTGRMDHFGIDVAALGDVVVVGAHWKNGGALHAGAAYVFRFDGW